MTTELDTKALRAQFEAATAGEWQAEGEGGIQMDGLRDGYRISTPVERRLASLGAGVSTNRLERAANAIHIVSAHNAFGALLDRAERATKYEAALRGVMPLIDEFGDTQAYGPFPGGDPRNFVPDEEDCSPQEIAAWKAACAEWDAGNREDRGPSCATMGDGSAWSGTGFGMGVYTWPTPPEVRAAREALEEPDAD